jgi:DNA-directed RNA polymerase subunit RPC12/RpoP
LDGRHDVHHWKTIFRRDILSDMKKSDLICPNCHAGYRRIELTTRPGVKGEYRCLLCDQLLERFDGSTEIAIRLTVQPEKAFE